MCPSESPSEVRRAIIRGRMGAVCQLFKSNHQVTAAMDSQGNVFLRNNRPVVIVGEVKPLLDLHVPRFAWFHQEVAQIWRRRQMG
jgi:hypothetical protein